MMREWLLRGSSLEMSWGGIRRYGIQRMKTLELSSWRAGRGLMLLRRGLRSLRDAPQKINLSLCVELNKREDLLA